MPREIDKIKYPSTVEEMIAHKEFKDGFLEFLITRRRGEQYWYYLLMQTPRADTFYADYIEPGNLPLTSKQSQLCGVLAAAVEAKQKDMWPKVIKQFQKDFSAMLKKGAVRDFYDYQGNPVFRDYHWKACFKRAEGYFGKTDAIMKRIGLKNKDLLKETLVNLQMSDWSAYEKNAKALIRHAGLSISTEMLNDALMKQQGLFDKKMMKVDGKRLVACGFTEVGNKDMLKLVTEMVELHLSGKKKDAAKVFDQVKKKEPKTSPIPKLKYDAMIKLFQAKNVIAA